LTGMPLRRYTTPYARSHCRPRWRNLKAPLHLSSAGPAVPGEPSRTPAGRPPSSGPTHPSAARRRAISLAIAAVVALLVLLPLALKVKVAEYDEAIFLDVARNLQRTGLPLRSAGEHGVPYLEHTPLLVLLLGLVVPKTPEALAWARGMTAAAGLGCVVLTYLVGERLAGWRAGLVAAVLLAASPFFAVNAFLVRQETFMALALLAALLILITDRHRGSPWRLALAGIALAAAVLFKEVALLFTAVCVIFVFLEQRAHPARAWRAAFLVGAPSVLALAVWAFWGWRLSPVTFSAVMQRWFASVRGTVVPASRTGLTAPAWASQLAFDLLSLPLVLGLLWALIRTARTGPRSWQAERLLLWGYLAAAIGASFIVGLKEPRHLIGVLPCAALLIGIACSEWLAGASNDASGGWRRAGAWLAVAVFLLAASPLRLLPLGPQSPARGLDPVYARLLLENDRFYGVLRLAAEQVRDRTAPGDVVTIAHQGTVVSYYADRHYRMLYPLSEDAVMQVLEGTDVLLWDDPYFLLLDAGQTKRVRDYVDQHFSVDRVVQDGERRVTIYRREARLQ
jgi:4-amino-4-deoxy-L-arabinose transferase-like glycosyltransferase